MSPRPYDEPLPDWTPEERPVMPGSPSTPSHPPLRRIAYFLVGALVMVTYALSNGFVTANLPQIQGTFGLTNSEGGWVTSAYFMAYMSANLLVFKARQQFGVQRFAQVAVLIFASVILLHLWVVDFTTLVAVRVLLGLAAAPMVAIGLFYLIQAFPKVHVGRGLCIALGFAQLSIPIGWVVSPYLTENQAWRPLYVFEFGMALLVVAAVSVLKLPRSVRVHAFEWRDLVSYGFFAPALALIAAVLGQVRILWWSDNPWMAACLIASILLLFGGLTFENRRSNPLIQTSWLGTSELIQFFVGSFFIRFILSEQSYAAVGVMRTLGMGPDQLQPLYMLIAGSMILGAVVAAAFFGPKRLVPLIMASIVLIVLAGYHDSNLTSLTRPHDLFPGQFAISCAAGMFMGPLLIMGVTKALSHGVSHMITFAVLFGVSQSVGGLSGAAVYSLFQQHREQEYSAQMISHLDKADPLVATRISQQAQALSSRITDPVIRQAEGVAQLSQTTTQQANVRAYIDVFILNCIIGIALFSWSLLNILSELWRQRPRPKRISHHSRSQTVRP